MEDHLALHGIPKSSREGKSIIKSFDESEREPEGEAVIETEEVVNIDEKQSDNSDGTQFTLDSY